MPQVAAGVAISGETAAYIMAKVNQLVASAPSRTCQADIDAIIAAGNGWLLARGAERSSAYLTVRAYAVREGISQRTVYRRISTKDVDAHRAADGHTWLIADA
jgi:hypothetical protein